MWDLPLSHPWIVGLAALATASSVLLLILRARSHHAMARRLRERDEDLAAVLESSPEVIGVMNTRSGRVEHLNGNAERLFGRPRAEVERLSPPDLSPARQPDGRLSKEAAADWVGRALRGEKPVFPWIFENAQGQPVPCEVRLVALPAPREHLVRFSVTDITERSQAEAETRRLTENLSRLVAERTAQLSESEAGLREAQRVGKMGSWRLDFASGRLTWSDEVYRIFEVDPDHFHATYPGFLACVHPADRDLVERTFRGALDSGTPYEVVHRVLLPEGRLRYVLERGEIAFDLQRQPLRAIGTVQDVTEVKLAEIAQRDSVRLLQSIIEHAPIRVFWKDRDLRYLGCNSQFAHDAGCQRPEEVIGRTDFDLAWRDQAELYRADDRAVMESRRAKLGYEEPQTTPDGRTLWLRTSKVPLIDDSGSMNGVLGIYEDVSVRKDLEAQLRQAQKLDAIGQLAGGVAHDFNNILASMLMNLGLLLLDRRLPQETRASLHEIESEAQRAARLTSQLLAFGRRSVLQIKPLDLNEIIAHLLHMLRRLLGETIDLRFDPGAALPRVKADAGLIEQMLVNLVVNARDAMPGGGRITLASVRIVVTPESAPLHAGRYAGEFVRLSVSDNGRGMEPEVVRHLFEPFFTTKAVGEGSGLGLATVHGIAAQHHGWIEVESTPGIGTTFLVHFPAMEPTPPTRTDLPNPAPLPSSASGILLVEDDARVRSLAARTLRNMGHPVREAADAAEALSVWNQHASEIQLLISDLIMPGSLNGLDLARRLRTDQPRLGLILTSGYGTEIMDAGDPQLPGLRYLPKPYSADLLIRAVHSSLESSAAPPGQQAASPS